MPLAPEVLPDELGLVLLPDDMPLLLPEVPEVPDAPEPVVPEAPEVSLEEGELLGSAEDEPLLPDVPEAPEPAVPDAPDEPELMPEAPVLPAVPASFLFWLLGLGDVPDMLLPEVEPAPVEDCASTTDDTDATSTNDKDRIVVFNVMSSSLG